MQRNEFCRLTGATVRQVDLWVRAGIDLCENDVKGQGNYRSYKASAVEAVKLLVNMQECFGHTIPNYVMKEVFDSYYKEHVRFGRIWLTWRSNRAVPGGSARPV